MFQNILVVYKKSKLDICSYYTGDSRTQWHLKRHFRNLSNSDDEQKRILETVIRLVKEEGVKYDITWRGNLKKEQVNSHDVVLVVGGDGTFIEAAKYCFDTPIAGVNSDIRGLDNKKVGSQASYSFFDRFNIREKFHEFLEGKIPITMMDRLSAKLEDIVECKTIVKDRILNDVAIGPLPNGIVRYRVIARERGFNEEQSADGYIIGTPQSSWPVHKYNGKTLPISEGYFQGVARGIAADRFAEKHDVVVVQKPLRIEVESLSRESVISFDGTHDNYHFGFGRKVIISLSEYPLKVIGFDNERRLKYYAVHREPRIINLSS